MKLTNILFVALMLFTIGAFAEDYTTENLINNQWYGTQTTTTQTGGENSHTISSGPTPAYNSTTNEIIFSYGQYSVAQSIGINQVLGSIGLGVALSGYNYSFDYYNQDFNRGFLYFDVLLFGNNGSLLESFFTQLQQTTQGYTNVSGTQTFASPYDISLLNSLNVYFTGRDDRFWAGYYGPKVKDVNVSLNYTYVYDPCASDPLYSSSCPGYWEAFIQQLCASGVTFLCSSQSSVQVTEVDDLLPIAITTQPVQALDQETTTGEVKIDVGGVELSTTGELSVPDGIPEESKEKKETNVDIAGIVRRATDETQTVQIVNKSIEESQDDLLGINFSLTGDILNDPLSEILFLRSLFGGLSANEENDSENSSSQQIANIDTNASNVTIEQVQETNEETTVNQNAESNDAAGGVDIASIAVTPAGFNSYLSKNIIDAKFYEEKEIYKGQVVVDNRRAQRLLSGASDRLHEEMVNEQYKR